MKYLTNEWAKHKHSTKRTSTLSDGTQVGYLHFPDHFPEFVIGNNELFFYGDEDKLYKRAKEFPKKDRTKILNGWKKFCRYYEKNVD